MKLPVFKWVFSKIFCKCFLMCFEFNILNKMGYFKKQKTNSHFMGKS